MASIIFFTGAGISAAAGIPTFRDPGGLWRRYDPEIVCSARGFNKNRWLVSDFHNHLRREIEKAEPTPAHLAIAAFEKEAPVRVITQNVDNLHERAGSANIIKLHGDLFTARIKGYKEPTIAWHEDITKDSFPIGWERCRGRLRHDVVLFGENVRHVKEANSELQYADYLVVCGTSLEVHPAAGLVLQFLRAVRILVDPNPKKEIARQFDDIIDTDANSGIPKAIDWIRKNSNLKPGGSRV